MWISKHKLKSVVFTLKNSLSVDSILISLQFWILVKLRTKNKVLKQFELSDVQSAIVKDGGMIQIPRLKEDAST